MIVYHDENDKEVQLDVRELITSVTASASKKKTHKDDITGDFDSNDAFQSYTATVPPSLPPETIQQIGNELYTLCETAVSERIAFALVQPEDRRIDGGHFVDHGSEDNPQPEWIDGSAPSELDNYFEPRNEPGIEQPASSGDEYPFIQNAPGASGCKPEQKYSTDVVAYRLDVGEELLKFYQPAPRNKWPAVTISYPSAFFDVAFGLQWEPKGTKKGDHVPLTSPLRLSIKCTGSDNLTRLDKETGKGGNPYRNIVKAESVKKNNSGGVDWDKVPEVIHPDELKLFRKNAYESLD